MGECPSSEETMAELMAPRLLLNYLEQVSLNGFMDTKKPIGIGPIPRSVYLDPDPETPKETNAREEKFFRNLIKKDEAAWEELLNELAGDEEGRRLMRRFLDLSPWSDYEFAKDEGVGKLTVYGGQRLLAEAKGRRLYYGFVLLPRIKAADVILKPTPRDLE